MAKSKKKEPHITQKIAKTLAGFDEGYGLKRKPSGGMLVKPKDPDRYK